VKRRRLLPVAIGLIVLVGTAIALARPGGGQSYSGSSSGSSSSGSGSGGGGGDGELIGLVFELLIWLCFEHPAIGIPLVIGVGIGLFVLNLGNKADKGWESSIVTSSARRRMNEAGRKLDATRREDVRQSFERMKKWDPEFSIALFEDFLFSLYTEVHVARGAGLLEQLAPYVSQATRSALSRGNVSRVEAVVIGAVKYLSVSGIRDEASPRIGISIEIHANYTEVVGEQPTTYYVVERWELSRSRRARSRPPKRARTIDCPNCGAPLDKIVNATCTYCHAAVATGEFDWMVDSISVVTREPRPPALTGDVEERGTDSPTVVEPSAENGFAALQGRDPAVTLPALEARARLIFSEVQRGWNARNLLLARAYLSDRLFETLGYWLDAYARATLVNCTENSRVTRVELSRVVHDVHFDSVTLRVFATGLDFTLDGNGDVVSGNRDKERAYSEYWTLIRGSAVTGPPRTDKTCPNCGAPLDINRTGTCNPCKAEITSGDFDWVLSKIEQDDDYG
jgi:hypothetical protein